jgi:hypothetical protein
VLNAIGWTTGATWILNSATNSQLDTTTILAPYADRLIMEGDTTVMAETLANANALRHLQEVANTEFGMLFMGADGTVRFYNRLWRSDPTYLTSVATFSDAVGGTAYTDYRLDYDDADIYNDVRMTRRDGVEQAVADATSKLDYWPRTLAHDRLLMTTDSECADRANYLLARYKSPYPHSHTLALTGSSDVLIWPRILGLEIGDRITVTRTPQGGAAITYDYYIEGIQHEIGDGGRVWHTKYALSRADATAAYWLVSAGGDAFAPYAILGVTTICGY